jgi:hypothetical protein
MDDVSALENIATLLRVVHAVQTERTDLISQGGLHASMETLLFGEETSVARIAVIELVALSNTADATLVAVGHIYVSPHEARGAEAATERSLRNSRRTFSIAASSTGGLAHSADIAEDRGDARGANIAAAFLSVAAVAAIYRPAALEEESRACLRIVVSARRIDSIVSD